MKLSSKKFIILFLICITIFSIPLIASSGSLTPTESSQFKETIQRLKNLQSSIYTISQNIIFSPESSVTSVANAISPVKSALDTTIKSLSDELPEYQNNNSAYLSVLLLQNAVNYMRASLIELERLSQQSTPSEKAITAERFYLFRGAARDILNTFESIS